MCLNPKRGGMTVRLCVVFILMAGAAQAASAPNALVRAKQAIQAAYHAEDVGYAERDVDVALSYHGGSYSSVDSDGRTLSFDRTHEGLTALFFSVQACHAQTTFRVFRETPDGYTAVIEKRISMTLAPGAGKIKRVVVLDQKRRDLWARNVLGWRLQRSTILSQSKTVNGKTVAPPP